MTRKSLGIRIGGAAHAAPEWWGSVLAAHSALLPAYPGAAVVPAARVPAPPQVVDGKLPAQAAQLVRAYHAAIARHYSRGRGTAVSSDPLTLIGTEHYSTLLNAIPTMIEYKAAPDAWVEFSFWFWAKHVQNYKGKTWDATPSKIKTPRAGMPPPLKWVYSPKRLIERNDYFAWAESRTKGGRVLCSPAQRTLLRRYSMLRQTLWDGSGAIPTAAVVTAAVEIHLPRALYTRLVREAAEYAEEAEHDMQKALKRGDYIWG